MSIAVGLVGFGFSARTLHRPLILAAGMDIKVVLTRQQAAVGEILPSACVVADMNALLAVEPLDLVVIATPNHLHYTQALAALEHGKHVVLDKPLALSSLQAGGLIEAAQRRGRKLSVFQNRRWDSDFLTLQRLVAQDALGRIVAYEARWDRFRPVVTERWREQPNHGGGVLYDLGSHLIDQAVCLFGRPDWLQADMFAQRAGARVDDGFEIRMGRRELRIVLGVSSLAADHALRYRVHGLKGSYRKSGLDVQEQQLRAGMAPQQAEFGLEPQAQWGCIIGADGQEAGTVAAERGRWSEFYASMRRSLEHDGPVPVSAAEARHVLDIIEAAQRSSHEGRRIEFTDMPSSTP